MRPLELKGGKKLKSKKSKLRGKKYLSQIKVEKEESLYVLTAFWISEVKSEKSEKFIKQLLMFNAKLVAELSNCKCETLFFLQNQSLVCLCVLSKTGSESPEG